MWRLLHPEVTGEPFPRAPRGIVGDEAGVLDEELDVFGEDHSVRGGDVDLGDLDDVVATGSVYSALMNTPVTRHVADPSAE